MPIVLSSDAHGSRLYAKGGVAPVTTTWGLAAIAEMKGVKGNWTADLDSAHQNTPGFASGTSSISLIYFFASGYTAKKDL